MRYYAISGYPVAELTQQQMGTIDIIGKRLWLIDRSCEKLWCSIW
ncbi:protein of unknown function [Acidithiobacillus ferrivorans]|nr:protein of unknown function [Acidithiobacillus ferrivorans]